jgi:hypothetical protein
MRRALIRIHQLISASLLLAISISVSAACAPIRLASAYDQQVDEAATRLQKELDGFLSRFEILRTGDDDRRYLPNRNFYLEYAVELRALETRVSSQPKNERSEEQIQLMSVSVEELRKLHQEQDDISAAAAQQFRKLFQTGWKAIITYELAKKR